jgi:predicted MFS family arabinose efflux permease
LIGLTLFLTNIGGAVGSWLAGRIFDLTSAYEWAFAAGMISAIISLVMALMLKRNRGK